MKVTGRREEFVRIWRPRNVDGIELYSACLHSQSFVKHFHEEYTIGINDAGTGSFWCCGANQIAGPKSLNLLAPGEVHTGAAAAKEGWTYRNLYVAPSMVERIAEQLCRQPPRLPNFRQSIGIDVQAYATVDRAFRALNSGHSRLESETAMLIALRLLFERFGDWKPSKSRIRQTLPVVAKARKYIEERYADEISLDEIADAGRVSPFYLIRCFRKELGLPPHAYQLQLRLQSAKADLKSSSSLTEVALKNGFFDQSHFHRHFKRTFGVTPAQYRRGNFVQDG